MSIEIVGVEKVERDLQGISQRILDMEPAFREATVLLEASEARLFDQLGGRYVRTGALRQSLTTPGAGVREVTPHGLAFGSDVYYARFQVEDPGPVTPAGGLERKGHPSAVLKLSEADAETVARGVMRHVTEGGGLL
jgi:hypothetical protein